MYNNDPYAHGNYGTGAYPAYPQNVYSNGGYPYPQPIGTNTLAIVALVLTVVQFFTLGVTTIPAIICGHIALSQIRKTGESGNGMAIASLVISYLALAFCILCVILLGVGLATAYDISDSVGTGYAMATL